MTLVYLYWKPTDADEHRLFEIDADEVGRFAAAVDRSTLAFESLGYPEPVTPSSVWLTQPSSATMETIPR